MIDHSNYSPFGDKTHHLNPELVHYSEPRLSRFFPSSTEINANSIKCIDVKFLSFSDAQGSQN